MCIVWWFSVHIHCEMIGTIKLINTSVSCDCCFLFVCFLVSLVRMHTFYTLSRFQIYKTEVSTIVTILFITSSELTHHIIESLYPLTNIFLRALKTTILFCFYEFDIFFFQILHDTYSICLFFRILHLAWCSLGSSMLLQMAEFPSSLWLYILYTHTHTHICIKWEI